MYSSSTSRSTDSLHMTASACGLETKSFLVQATWIQHGAETVVRAPAAASDAGEAPWCSAVRNGLESKSQSLSRFLGSSFPEPMYGARHGPSPPSCVWQQVPESATNEDTLDTLVKHGLINRVYLPLVTSYNILAVHWLSWIQQLRYCSSLDMAWG